MVTCEAELVEKYGLSTNFSFSGKHLVLLPFGFEKAMLKSLADRIANKNITGYVPAKASSFMDKLDTYTELDAKIIADDGYPDGQELFGYLVVQVGNQTKGLVTRIDPDPKYYVCADDIEGAGLGKTKLACFMYETKDYEVLIAFIKRYYKVPLAKFALDKSIIINKPL